MLFSDYSCISRTSVQTLAHSGIYTLLGLSWASIVVILHTGKAIIEAENDCGSLGHDIPAQALDAHRYDILRAGSDYGTLAHGGRYYAYFLIRTDTNYNVYYYFAKEGAPFSDKDLKWFSIYNKKSYSALVLNNELIQTHEYLSNIIDSINSYVMIFDLNMSIISYNDRCKQLLCKSPSAGAYAFDHLKFDHLDRVKAGIKAAVDTEQKQFLSSITLTPPNQDNIFSVIISPLHNSKKVVSGVILICNDKSQDYLLQLQTESIEKYKFISDIALGLSHDIKNPLMNIQSCTSFLLQHELQQQERRAVLHDITLEADRVDTIVNQLLSYCSVSTEDVFSFVNINDILSTCVLVVSRQKLFKAIAIQPRLGDNLPPIKAKSGDLYQVFLNIILNAVQAIEATGNIVITSALDEETSALVIAVSDDGPGIGKEQLAEIFTPFYTTKPQGTGVGLYLSSKLLQKYRGSITVRSGLGQLTTFTVRLPVA